MNQLYPCECATSCTSLDVSGTWSVHLRYRFLTFYTPPGIKLFKYTATASVSRRQIMPTVNTLVTSSAPSPCYGVCAVMAWITKQCRSRYKIVVLSKARTPLHGHRLRTCCTTPPTDTTNGRAHNNSTTNLPHRNARAQHLDMSRCWDVANFCPLVVNVVQQVAEWALPLVVFVSGVVEFGPN